MAGYSKNPLFKKLGIKEKYTCHVFNPPKNYFELLENIPLEMKWDDDLHSSSYDFIHVFVQDIDDLESNWNHWKTSLKKNGLIWVSWPKGTSKISTNLNGNIVGEFGLNGGLVDVKVCAVDKDWSGLKFMYRKKDR